MHPADRCKVKPRCYEEALTVDEINERLVERHTERSSPTSSSQRSRKVKPRNASPRPRGCKVSKKKSANSPGKRKTTPCVGGQSRSSIGSGSDAEGLSIFNRQEHVASDSEEEMCHECHQQYMDNNDEAKQY